MKMKVWRDIFTGDAMVSKEFKSKEIFGGAGLEVVGTFLAQRYTPSETIKEERSQTIGLDEVNGRTSSSSALDGRIDIVEKFGLKEIKLEKGTWGTYIKMYIKRINTKLEEENKVERIAPFQTGAADLARMILKMYDEVKLYQGKSGDALAGYAYCYHKIREDLSKRPLFLFFQDGLTTDEDITKRSTEQQAALVAANRTNSIRER